MPQMSYIESSVTNLTRIGSTTKKSRNDKLNDSETRERIGLKKVQSNRIKHYDHVADKEAIFQP